MKIDKLFQVIVAMGASSTVGLAACSSSTSGTGGPSSEDSGSGSSGSTGAMDAAKSNNGGDSSSCMCKPDPDVASWTDCNGCCCWLPAGSTSSASVPICGAEPCCSGHGRT